MGASFFPCAFDVWFGCLLKTNHNLGLLAYESQTYQDIQSCFEPFLVICRISLGTTGWDFVFDIFFLTYDLYWWDDWEECLAFGTRNQIQNCWRRCDASQCQTWDFECVCWSETLPLTNSKQEVFLSCLVQLYYGNFFHQSCTISLFWADEFSSPCLN